MIAAAEVPLQDHHRAPPMSHGCKAHQRNGFTLIEAFAVVALLAVAVVTVAPVFRPQEIGCRASCQNNLKQIGLGLMQYCQDNDDHYPRTATFSLSGSVGVNSVQTWRQAIYPYTKSRCVFSCPQAAAGRETESKIDGYPLCYDVTDCGPIRMDGSVRERDVPAPSNTILVFEKNGDTPQAQQIGVLWDSDNGEVGWTNILYAGHAAAGEGHGGSHYLFADGHVKWLYPMATLSDGINRWRLNNHDAASPRAVEKLCAAQHCLDPPVVLTCGTER